MAINNNVHWIIDNELETAAITTSASYLPGHGPENLLDEDKSFIFKTTSAAEYDLIFTFAQLTPISAIALLQYNADVNTTYRISGYATSDTNATPVYDSGIQNPILSKTWGVDWEWGIDTIDAVIEEGDDVFLQLIPLQQLHAIKIHIIDSNHPQNRSEIGRVFAGKGFQSQYNMDYGIEFTDENQAEIIDTFDSLLVESVLDRKSLRFALNNINDVEHLELREKLKKVKNHKDILVSAYPNAAEVKKNMYTVLGKLLSARSFKHNYHNNYQLEVYVKEN